MDTEFKVLYRKYRPKSFNEIVGQEYTIKMLKNAIISNKISHAYLFTGPRGTGKTSTAKIFAKTINCENCIDGIPCEKCSSCLNINNNADIIEIDAASNNGVDEIREIINNVKIAPSFSKYKVYIIDEVHMLSQSAFNALLLTLEEPPSHVVFILATTNVESVPITILSRCQRYEFKKLSLEEIENHLNYVSKNENIEITSDAIKEISYLSEGGLRDALSILNQLSTSNPSISIEIVIQNYGSISSLQIEKIIENYLESNFDELEVTFDELKKSSLDYKIFIKKLIDNLYNKAIIFKRKNDNILFEKIKNTILELNDVLNKININIDPFILILMTLMKYMDGDNSIINENSLDSLENKEKFTEKSEILKEKNDEKLKINAEISYEIEENNEYLQTIKNVRINNCLAKADKNNLNNFKNKWEDFIANNCSKNELGFIIIDAVAVVASSEIALFTLPQTSMVELFNNHLEKIEKNFNKEFDEKYKFMALSQEEWTKIKNDYIINLKNNYVYEILDEPVLEENNISKEEIDSKSNDEQAEDYFDIFNKEKIEIK